MHQNDPINQPVKYLVAHQNPDLDSIGAIWLFIRFGGDDFNTTQYYFVPAGQKMSKEEMAAKEVGEPEVVHVDTGLGPFDHHQPDNTAYDSATLRVYQYLTGKYSELQNNEALKRVVEFINHTDHFASCHWPEATDDRYGFMLEEILKGLRSARHFNDREMVEFGMVCLDGVLTSMKIKVSAEEDLKNLAYEFDCPWGKCLAIENRNDEVVKLAQKQGYQVVVRKDAGEGHIRIKAAPGKDIDLTPIYEAIISKDQEGTWYLHPSKAMLLNGSRKTAQHHPSPLALEQVVELIQSNKT